jgi:class 3 adenylate cyclase
MLRAMPASHYAAVVFLKIQEFARRSASEQARLRAQLQAVIAVTAAEIHAADRVVLEAADGAAIVVLDDPPAALRLAERALSAVAVGLPLSAGLNYGAVQLAGEGMTGDGIAAAAAVAAFAPPERVLASRAFRDALGNAVPGMDALLVRAGTFNDPGLRAHEVFRPSPKALARRRWRYGAVTALIAVALITGAMALREAAPGREPLVDAVLQKTEPYWRGLVQRVSY